jgi:hypothetical protein
LDTLDFLSAAPPAVPLLASGLGQVSDLKRRLTMIMRGTTPRALGWRGALTVLSLGALLLPVLPTRAQAPAREGERTETVKRVQISRDDSAPDLQKAEAELRKLEAEIARKKTEIAAAKARLKAEAVRGRLTEARRVQVREREGGPTVRIEIIISGDEKSAAVKELINKLEKVLPEGSRRIYLRTGGTGTGAGISFGGGGMTATFTRGAPATRARPGTAPEAPKPPAPPTVMPPGARGGFGGGVGGGLPGAPGGVRPPGLPGRRENDPRLEGLEKKLEAIMREVESLRRDLNRSRRGPGGAGGGAGSGAGGAPPAVTVPTGLPPIPASR